MDTSNSTADYVVNGYKAPLNQLSSREWLGVVKGALDRTGSVLNYLPHIRDSDKALQEVVNWRLYDVVNFSQKSPRLAWRSGHKHWFIEEKVRLVPLGSVIVSQPAPRDNGIGQLETLQTDVHLFVSTKRQWVKLERIFVTDRRGDHSFEEFLFCGLNEEELIETVGDNLVFWPRTLIFLDQLIWTGIHQKQQHISALEYASRHLVEMKSRVGPVSP